MTDTSLPTSNQDPTAIAAAKADPNNGITEDPGTPVGIKIDPASAQEIGQHIAAALSTPEAQAVESELVAGLPKKARGWIYAGVGALGTAASSVAAYGLTNPGVLPEWLTITAAIVAAPSNAVVGSSALANLGKK